MVYDELGMSDRGLDVWEHLAKSDPNNRENAVQYFMCAVSRLVSERIASILNRKSTPDSRSSISTPVAAAVP